MKNDQEKWDYLQDILASYVSGSKFLELYRMKRSHLEEDATSYEVGGILSEEKNNVLIGGIAYYSKDGECVGDFRGRLGRPARTNQKSVKKIMKALMEED